MCAGREDGGAKGEALPREIRITASDDIRTLFRRGKRRKTRYVDVFVSASPVSRSRLGLVVPKPRVRTTPGVDRVRGAGVQRNRLKRRLREIGRRWLLPMTVERACQIDILLRATPEAYQASFRELKEDLLGSAEWICSSARPSG